MFQITAIKYDSEIGYGEGESLQYALAECGASISALFENELVDLLVLENEARINLKGRVYLTIDGDSAITI